jgi:hypothetical protein
MSALAISEPGSQSGDTLSPLFGGGDKHDPSQDPDAVARTEIARLKSLPLERLASEVVAVGFPPTNTVDRGRVSVHDIALKMVSGVSRLSQDEIWELDELVGEGVQALEHDGLAQCTVVGTDRRLQWVLTRSGRTAAASQSSNSEL